MKRIVIVLGSVCVVLAGTAGWLIRENMLKTKALRDRDSANLALAYRLLSSGLTRNHVDLYAGDSALSASYSIGDFTIHVVPLTITASDSTLHLTDFLVHNHQAVLMHACHVWDTDRDLAIAELTLLSRVRPEAQAILDDYREHGRLTSTRGSIVDLHQSQWEWFAERFQQQMQKASNERVQPTN